MTYLWPSDNNMKFYQFPTFLDKINKAHSAYDYFMT